MDLYTCMCERWGDRPKEGNMTCPKHMGSQGQSGTGRIPSPTLSPSLTLIQSTKPTKPFSVPTVCQVLCQQLGKHRLLMVLLNLLGETDINQTSMVSTCRRCDWKKGLGRPTLSPGLYLLPEIRLFSGLQKMCMRGPSRWMERTPRCWSWTPGRLRNRYGTASRIWREGR